MPLSGSIPGKRSKNPPPEVPLPQVEALQKKLSEERMRLHHAQELLNEKDEIRKSLIENSPIPLLEMTICRSLDFLESLKKEGIENPTAHIASNPGALFTFMSHAELLAVNQAGLELFQAESFSAITGGFKKIYEKIPPDDLKRIFLAFMDGAHSIELDTIVGTLRDETRHVHSKFSLLEGEGDHYPRVIGFTLDLTERFKVEEALREREEKYRIIFEESPIPLWEADLSDIKKYIDRLRREGTTDFTAFFDNNPQEVLKCISMLKIIDVNAPVLRLLGAESKEFLYQNFSSIMCQELINTHKKGLICVAGGGTLFEDETINITFRGEKLYISFRLVVPSAYESTHSMILLSSVDITSLKETQQALSRAYDALKKAHDELELRVEQRTAELLTVNHQLMAEIQERKRLEQELLKKNHELEEFAFVVSHEVRNNIMGINRLLENTSRNPAELSDYCGTLARSSERLMKFIRNLLIIARAGKVIEKKEEVLIESMLHDIFRMLKPDAIRAELTITGDLPPILCDQQGMERVFTNLIGNSLNHINNEKGKIHIEVLHRSADGYHELVFKDDGSGIPGDSIGRIFEVAYTTKKDESFGFGLAIVKKIIEAHGGMITAKSGGAGKGTAFIIHLPDSYKTC